MNQESATAIALQSIAFIVSDDTLCPRFLALTGSDKQKIRARLNDEQFLAGALDFLLANERDLIEFCEANQISPDLPAKAKHILAGPTSWEDI